MCTLSTHRCAGDPRRTMHIGSQRLRNTHAPIRLLILLEDGDHRAPYRQARSVERVYVAEFPVLPLEACCHAARLKSSQLLHDEISRYAFCPGSQTSMS